MIIRTLQVTCAALLLTAGVASAQTSPPQPSRPNAAAPGKCWNTATNTVQDKATQGASGQRQPGGLTTGSGTSGNAANSTGQRLQTRPPGMPDC